MRNHWVAYALWIAGMAFSRTNARRALAAWEEGIAFVHEHRIGFFEGFIARDAARLHTSDGEPMWRSACSPKLSRPSTAQATCRS
jgi:hypothetical protein